MNQSEIVFFARPTLRRAYFFALIYTACLSYGRMLVADEYPMLNQVWYGAFGVLVVCLAIAHIRRYTTSYTITTDSVAMSWGILTRAMAEIPPKSITNVSARQSLLGRILGMADLYIDCAGGDHEEVRFKKILSSEARDAAKILRQFMARTPGAPAQPLTATEPRAAQQG